MKTEIQLVREFEDKFGFECYDELRKIMGKMYERIKVLTICRNMWKERFNELKKKVAKSKRKQKK